VSTIQLRPKQDRVISEARAKLKTVTRLLLQAPCGFGKTVLGSYMALNASTKGRRVYFLTHRDELAKQASRTMTAFGIEHGFIMAAFTMQRRHMVQIAMIDTLRNRLEQVPVPGLLIVDECHHAVSKSWQKVIDYYHSKGCVVVGLSATPQRLDGRPLNDIFDDMVLGPTVRELIEDGALSNYTYYAPPQVAQLDDIKMKYGEFDQKAMAEQIDKPQVFGDAIEHFKKIMPGKRAIAFHVNIEGSKHFAEQCRAAGIPALHVDGEMKKEDRASAIKSFERGETLILSNVSLFGEGFDVKACEGVILLRRTASLSLFIQMCGRAMRPHESKDRAIILDHVGNLALHGLPDKDHDWTLEGRQKRKGKKKDADEPTVDLKQCPACYVVHAPSPTCPRCGHEYPVGGGRGEMEQVDGELLEITPEMQAALRAKEQAKQRSAQAAAKSVDDMMSQLGYSRGRAEAIVKHREEKAAIRVGLINDLQAWQQKTGQTAQQVLGIYLSDLKMMKPKGLKELREKFDQHRLAHLGARPGDDVEFAQYMQDSLLPTNSQPGGEPAF